MSEVIEVQAKRSVGLKMRNVAHLLEIPMLAVRRQAHHFVFVAVMRDTGVLSDRFVEDPQGVREVNFAVDLDPIVFSDAPGSAREVAETVDRHDDGTAKR